MNAHASAPPPIPGTGDPRDHALAVAGLRAGYGSGGDIVCGIDLVQRPESILAVIGPNGSGKSSFIKTLAGLLPARAGAITITGRDITPSRRRGGWRRALPTCRRRRTCSPPSPSPRT